jgi:mercuric ion transport protein
LLDKTGAIGTLTAAMGCASCFPALGSLGAALGLGFLAQFEGLFINTLLPIFAAVALAANIFSYFSHKIWYRTLAGMTGPTMVLLTLFPLWVYGWSTYLLYAGIALMVVVSIWDMVSPPRKVCSSCSVTDEVSENV